MNYDEIHADIRKPLKELVPASKKWLDTVNKPLPDPACTTSLVSSRRRLQRCLRRPEATKLQTDLDKYFAEQKKQKKEQDKTGYVPLSSQ